MTGAANADETGRTGLAGLLGRLPWHALTTFGVRIIAAGLTYGVQIILARTLGDHDYGLFSLAWVWVMFGGYLGCLGLSQTAVRFLPGYHDQRDHGRVAGFLRFSIRVTLAVSLLLALLAFGALFAAESAGIIGSEYHWPLAFGALCLPFFAFQDLFEGLARARGAMLAAFVPPYILRGLFLVCSTFGLLAAGAPAGASTAMAGALIGTVLACLLQAALVLPLWRAERRAAKEPVSEAPEWRRATLPLFFADGAQMLRQYVDVILLGLIVEPAMLGVYFATSRIVALLGLIEYSVGAMSGPRFSVAEARGDAAMLARTLQDSAMLIFWPTLTAAIGLIILGPWLLGFFGAEFAAGAGLIGLLVIGPVCRALAGCCEEMLNMLGHGAATLRAHLFAMLTGAALLLWLTPQMGLSGAALAASAASAVNGVALIAYAYRRTGLMAHPWPERAAPARREAGAA